MDANGFINILGNFGFPITISLYLLVRLEKKTDELNFKISKFMDILNRRDD